MPRTGIVLALPAALLAGCAGAVAGRANPVALGVADGPSGPRPGAPPADLEVDGGDGGEIDSLATAAVADVERY